MRPHRNMFQLSLMLNIFLLVSYGTWYLYTSEEVPLTPEPTYETTLLTATVAAPSGAPLVQISAADAASGAVRAAEVPGGGSGPRTTAAAATQDTANDTTAEPPGPHCAVSKLSRCQDVEPRAYNALRGTHYWVMYNLVMAERRFSCDETVTYTTHGDFTFLDNLAPLTRRWRAPVSFALYAPADDFKPSMEALAYLRMCDEPLIRQLVTFHVVFDTDKMPKNVTQWTQLLERPLNCSLPPPWVGRSSYRKAKKLTYPVNVLRNVARQTVGTHFVLPSDVELYPSEGLAEQFIAMVHRNAPVLCQPRPRVFVLSIFEVAANYTPPPRKDRLTGMLKNGTAVPFHKYMCPTCHRIPKAKEWTFSKDTQQLDVFHTAKRYAPHDAWEPIHICTNEAPDYDERLTWEGKMDKMGQGYTMCIQDYDFMILNNAFLVHKPGIKKYKPDKWRETLAGKQRRFITGISKVELDLLYGQRAKCKLH